MGNKEVDKEDFFEEEKVFLLPSEYIVIRDEKVVERFKAYGAKAAYERQKEEGSLYIKVGN